MWTTHPYVLTLLLTLTSYSFLAVSSSVTHETGQTMTIKTDNVDVDVPPLTTNPDPKVQKVYKIFHAFGLLDETNKDVFELGGTILLEQEEGSTEAVVEQEVTIEGRSAEQLDARGKENEWVRVKVVEEDTGRSASTILSACELRRSNLRVELTLTLGMTGSILSLSYTPLISPLAPSCHSFPTFSSLADANQGLTFHTKVTYTTGTPGMTLPQVLTSNPPPNGLVWLPRTGYSGKGKVGNPHLDMMEDANTPPEHQSFLRRYWYIILPLLIITTLGGENNPPSTEKDEHSGSANIPTDGSNVTTPQGSQRLPNHQLQPQNTSINCTGRNECNSGEIKQRRGKRG